MNTLRLFTSLLLLSSITGTVASAQSQCSRSNARTIIYEHPYYRGATLGLSGSGSIGDLRERDRHWWGSWNDAISSIEIPAGYQAILFRDKFFSGPAITLTGNISNLYDLRGVDWDDQASSLKIVSISQCESRPKAIFYDQPFFRGRSFEAFPGESRERLRDKRRGSWGNWNDRIESVQIIGDFDIFLFEDTHFSGRQIWLSESVEDLDQLEDGWGDRASSFEAGF